MSSPLDGVSSLLDRVAQEQGHYVDTLTFILPSDIVNSGLTVCNCDTKLQISAVMIRVHSVLDTNLWISSSGLALQRMVMSEQVYLFI